jgi:hypothetical protein
VQEPEIIEQIEARADSKIASIRQELMEQISVLAGSAGGTAAKVRELRQELLPLVEEAMARSRHAEAEAREETLRDVRISHVRAYGSRGVQAASLFNFVGRRNREWQRDFLVEIEKLRDEGVIDYKSDRYGAIPSTERIVYVAGSPRAEATPSQEKPDGNIDDVPTQGGRRPPAGPALSS